MDLSMKIWFISLEKLSKKKWNWFNREVLNVGIYIGIKLLKVKYMILFTTAL